MHLSVPYWLSTIRFHAPKSPILLVATHADTLKKKRKELLPVMREDISAAYGKKYTTIAGVHLLSVATCDGLRVRLAQSVC